MTPEPLFGLYVHVPFCSAICNYCNFNRGLFDESLKSRFVDALIQEISTARRAGPFGPADGAASDTLYFGGGTPSLLSPDDISRIIEAARQSCRLAPDAEITLEANPESVYQARLEGLR